LDERDIYELAGGNENTGVIRDDYAHGLPAIVANVQDPQNRHRIQVIIPSIDEAQIFPKWIDRGDNWFADGPGFGDYHLPGLGSEVFISGTRGEKYHWRYGARCNENYVVPPVFQGRYDVRGYHTNQNYEEHIDGNHLLTALQNDLLVVGVDKTDTVGGNWSVNVGGTIEIAAGGVLTLTGSIVNLNGSVVNVNAAGGLFVNGVQLIVP
jgi:hypothetical protein